MKILVTAGNTQTPIDEVRCITNIFSGRTGAVIAASAFERGHQVMLLTSHPEVVSQISVHRPRQPPDWEVAAYRTYEQLQSLMANQISSGGFDAVIHAAAVSDYHVTGVFAPHPGSRFDAVNATWSAADGVPRLIDASAGKVKSSHGELWLRLVPARKLVDEIRSTWGFRGVLVKFKLEVGVDEPTLLAIAERSRLQSQADLMAANTLEGMADWAYLGAGSYVRLPRAELAQRLLEQVERIGKATDQP